MTEENWIDWPNGAQLKDLPVGSRVRYREAHYVRTENGLRAYWAARAKKIVGTEYLLSKQAFIEPIKVSLPSGYRFEGSEVVKDCCERYAMAEAGGVAHVCVGADQAFDELQNQAYAQGVQSYARAIQNQRLQVKPSDGLANGYVFRQGDYQQTGIQYGDCPRPECARKSWNPMRDRCDHCGVTGKEIAAKRAKPACKCGATENVRHVAWGQHRCGSCEQSRRRAELQAQKLEQTKRDMNRPVKRDPYEWLGFSSADWEE